MDAFASPPSTTSTITTTTTPSVSQTCPFCTPTSLGRDGKRSSPPLCFHGNFFHPPVTDSPSGRAGGGSGRAVTPPYFQLPDTGTSAATPPLLPQKPTSSPPPASLVPLHSVIGDRDVQRPITAAGAAPPAPPASALQGSTNVYVSNLPAAASDDWLRNQFSRFGLITSTKVMTNHGRSKNKGYGFVQFTEPQMALSAVKEMNNHTVEGGLVLCVKLADHDKNRGIANGPSTNIYIGNLPLEYEVNDVAAIFSKFGTISSLVVLTDAATGASRGVALVRFASIEFATSAISAMNGKLLQGHDRPLEVKYAENHQEKALRRHGGKRGAVNGDSGPSTSQSYDSINEAFLSPFATPLTTSEAGALSITSAGLPPASSPAKTWAAIVRGAEANGQARANASRVLPPAGEAPTLSAPADGMYLTDSDVAPSELHSSEDLLETVSQAIQKLMLPSPESGTSLYVHGVPSSISDLHLYKLFAPFGALADVSVIRHAPEFPTMGPSATNPNAHNRDYAIVQYRRSGDCSEAQKQLDGAPFMGIVLQLSFQPPRAPVTYLSKAQQAHTRATTQPLTATTVVAASSSAFTK